VTDNVRMTLIVPEQRKTYPRNPRGFVVHGWAFMDLPDEEVEAIKTFLDSGRVDDLPERWRRLARDYAQEVAET
jgi:hypothetical protein